MNERSACTGGANSKRTCDEIASGARTRAPSSPMYSTLNSTGRQPAFGMETAAGTGIVAHLAGRFGTNHATKTLATVTDLGETTRRNLINLRQLDECLTYLDRDSSSMRQGDASVGSAGDA